MSAARQLQNILPELWERQEGESAQAFQGFAVYRDMGAERSLAKVAQKLGKSKALMERWSARWQWGIRADAWDRELDRVSRIELEKGIVGMRKQHAEIAQAMLDKASKALRRVPVKGMTPKDIATMVETAARLERISRGEATERTEEIQTIAGELSVRKSIDLSGISDEELAQLDEITGKIFGK